MYSMCEESYDLLNVRNNNSGSHIYQRWPHKDGVIDRKGLKLVCWLVFLLTRLQARTYVPIVYWKEFRDGWRQRWSLSEPVKRQMAGPSCRHSESTDLAGFGGGHLRLHIALGFFSTVPAAGPKTLFWVAWVSDPDPHGMPPRFWDSERWWEICTFGHGQWGEVANCPL